MSDSDAPIQYKMVVKKGRNLADYDTVRFSISVGQPYHEGGKLSAAFQWAAKRYPHAIVSVNDTLQRHNFTNPDAHAITRKAGDEWIERNKDKFAILADPQIQRWDDWLAHPDYTDTRAMVDRLYTLHDGFRSDIDATCDRFAERRGTDPKASREYLLEETAVFAIQSAIKPAVDAYPGSAMAIWERFRTENVAGAPEGLKHRNFTRIDFARVKVA